MLSLPQPATASSEDKTVKIICSSAPWDKEQTAWLAAYSLYRRKRGDPWQVPVTIFSKDVGDLQRGFYKSRRKGGPIARVRAALDLPCCAMCGSHHNGTLDHYLPKEDWPEFSILLANLVPACSLCNSGSKGRTVKGTTAAERFLHPYYDTVARLPLWRTDITAPYIAPTFQPTPLRGFAEDLRTQLEFHLQNILGDHFLSTMETQWSRLPGVLRVETGPAPTFTASQRALRAEYRRTRISAGVNGWRTSLLRGALANPGAIAHLQARI